MLNQNKFFQEYPTAANKFPQTGFEWKNLQEIHQHYSSLKSELELVVKSIADRLRDVDEVHSIRMRIKDPEHVIEKIIRKTSEGTFKDVDVNNYGSAVTDLIGVRAMHLFKEDWLDIHKYITSTWEMAETPVANIRDGDPQYMREAFEKEGCEIKEHVFGYRSLHYLIKSKPAKKEYLAEIQVRTIFEEGWSEIDHRIRYPYHLDNKLLAQFLTIFNRLAGSADEMGSYIQYLKEALEKREQEYNHTMEENRRLIDDLRSRIDKLEIESKVKDSLSLTLSDLHIEPITFPDLSGILDSFSNLPDVLGKIQYSLPDIVPPVTPVDINNILPYLHTSDIEPLPAPESEPENQSKKKNTKSKNTKRSRKKPKSQSE